MEGEHRLLVSPKKEGAARPRRRGAKRAKTERDEPLLPLSPGEMELALLGEEAEDGTELANGEGGLPDETDAEMDEAVYGMLNWICNTLEPYLEEVLAPRQQRTVAVPIISTRTQRSKRGHARPCAAKEEEEAPAQQQQQQHSSSSSSTSAGSSRSHQPLVRNPWRLA
jgi:hypothetical protein